MIKADVSCLFTVKMCNILQDQVLKESLLPLS